MPLSFTSDLIPAAEKVRVNTDIENEQKSPNIATLADGGFVVSWASQDQDGSGWGIFAQRYDAQGAKVSAEFQVNTNTALDQIDPSGAGLQDGGFIISWGAESDQGAGPGTGIFAQRYDATGATVGSEVMVTTTNAVSAGDKAQARALGLSNGGYGIFWSANENSGPGLFGQLYDGSGAPVGLEFGVTPDDNSSNSFLQLSSLANGGFVAIWSSLAQATTYSTEVVGQVFDETGAKTGQTFRVNSYRYGPQYPKSVEPLEDGGFVVTWQSLEAGVSEGRWAQRFDADGVGVGIEFQVFDTDTLARLNSETPYSFSFGDSARLNDGSLLIAQIGPGPDGQDGDIYLQRFVDSPDALILGNGMQAHQTPEISGQVYRLYHAALERDPDSVGFLNWIDQLKTATSTLADVASGFVNSAEFQVKYGVLTDGQYVGQLYHNILGRAPDAGGLANWVDALAGGATRAQVLIGFSQSDEYQNDTAGSATAYIQSHDPASWTGEVFRMYQAGLERNPDPLGFIKFTLYLADGATPLDIMTEFVASPEFRPAYDAMTNVEFVAAIYQTVLGRPADAGGLSAWTAALDGGASRAQVVLAFSQSSEFKTLQADPLEAWMRGHGTQPPLNGGPGNDTLAGGLGADVFVFDAGDAGDNVVMDLEPWDTLHLAGFGYAGDNDARDHMIQSGADVIFADQGVRVTLQGVDLGQIDNDIIQV